MEKRELEPDSPHPFGEGASDHGNVVCVHGITCPSPLSSPSSLPRPRNLVQGVTQSTHHMPRNCFVLLSSPTRTHSVRPPCPHHPFWSCVGLFLVQTMTKGAEQVGSLECPALCSILETPEGPCQHFPAPMLTGTSNAH